MLLFINKFIIFSILTIRACNCLGCFVCNSVNGSNSLCEDPFNNFNDTFYEENCKAGIPGRIGIYPSTDCVKIKGTYVESGQSFLVRTCSVEDFDQDSLRYAMVKVSQQFCGVFHFLDENTTEESGQTRLSGCFATCNNVDGCNKGKSLLKSTILFYCLLFTCLVGILAQTLLIGSV